MDKQAVHADIQRTLGLVPAFMRRIPDDAIEEEWTLFKHIEFGDGAIPNKYRELIGVGIAAATKCPYCALFHTEAAKLFGATEAEVEYAVRYAKNSAGWSAYLNGMQFDYGTFKKEVAEITTFVRGQATRDAGSKPEVSAPLH